MKKFKMGFTLAEVLITLSIIGVVAAIVMPSVMSSYQYKTVGVKLSKFASMIEQSARAYVVMNDTLTYNAADDGTTTDTITPFLQESLILNPNTKEQQISFVGATRTQYKCTAKNITQQKGTYKDCYGKTEGDTIWITNGTPDEKTAEDITNLKKASSENAGNIITLKDNTQLTYYWVNPDETDSYYDQDAERVGRVSFVLSFKPNVKGLPTGVQDTYNFAVSELGYVFPSKTDACLTAIASNDWVSTGAVFKAGKSGTNGGVCNIGTGGSGS